MSRVSFILLLLILTNVLSVRLYAEENASEEFGIDICNKVYYYYDSTNKLQLSEILKEDFFAWSKYSHEVQNSFIPATNLWVKTLLTNNTDTLQYQYLECARFDFADCYLIKNDKDIDTVFTNRLLDAEFLGYNNVNIVFKIPIRPRQETMVVAKLYRITSARRDYNHFRLQTEVETMRQFLYALNCRLALKYFNLVFVGALSIFGLFFFCQYLQQRKQFIFLIYVCYLVCIVLHALREFFRYEGISGTYALFTKLYYYSEVPLTYSIYILYTLFFIYLLDLRNLNKTAFKYARVIVILFIVSFVLDIYIKVFHSVLISYTYFYFLRIPLLMLPVPILFFSFKSRSAYASYFFYGSLALFIGVLYNLIISGIARNEQYSHLLKLSANESFWNNPIVYSRIGMLIEVVFFSLGLASKSKLEFSAASNDALKSNLSLMINHSVSNALNKLKGLIKRNEGGVLTYIDETGDIMQNMLNIVHDHISLSQEIVLAKKFFNFRNEGTEAIHFTINSNDIETQEYYVPPMLLQPFIENCIEHAWTENDTDKRINVNIYSLNNMATIEIIDNGKGINKELGSPKSHGMILIAERIKYFNSIFDAKIIFSISNSNKSKGTTVTIKNIPYKK